MEQNITWLYRDFVEHWNLCCHAVTSRESSISQSVSSFMSGPYFYLTQCDMKKLFASLSKFVSESARQKLFSIMGWGKLIKSKFLVMSNKSIMAKSLSIVSSWPNCYSVTFWGSCEEVKLYNKTQSSCKWSFTILSQSWRVETWRLAVI